MLDEQRASTEPSQYASGVQDDGRLTYTLTEAASRLGISRALAYEAAQRGELPVCRIGRRVLVPRVALLRLLEQDAPLDSRPA
jgi:excisionase family DNA binding protein